MNAEGGFKKGGGKGAISLEKLASKTKAVVEANKSILKDDVVTKVKEQAEVLEKVKEVGFKPTPVTPSYTKVPVPTKKPLAILDKNMLSEVLVSAQRHNNAMINFAYNDIEDLFSEIVSGMAIKSIFTTYKDTDLATKTKELIIGDYIDEDEFDRAQAEILAEEEINDRIVNKVCSAGEASIKEIKITASVFSAIYEFNGCKFTDPEPRNDRVEYSVISGVLSVVMDLDKDQDTYGVGDVKVTQHLKDSTDTYNHMFKNLDMVFDFSKDEYELLDLNIGYFDRKKKDGVRDLDIEGHDIKAKFYLANGDDASVDYSGTFFFKENSTLRISLAQDRAKSPKLGVVKITGAGSKVVTIKNIEYGQLTSTFDVIHNLGNKEVTESCSPNYTVEHDGTIASYTCTPK